MLPSHGTMKNEMIFRFRVPFANTMQIHCSLPSPDKVVNTEDLSMCSAPNKEATLVGAEVQSSIQDITLRKTHQLLGG